MAIDDVRLPEKWSRGSAGGPAFSTEIVQMLSGDEDREERWEHPLWQYDIAHNVKSPADIAELRGFHLARRGAARGFLLKDWIDWTSATDGISAASALDQPLINPGTGLATGDGSETEFALVKRYADSAGTFDRPILWPVAGTLLVAVDGAPLGSGFSVARGTGLVTFTSPPANGAVLTAGFAFDVPVRFSEDLLSVSWDTIASRSAGQVPLQEVRS